MEYRSLSEKAKPVLFITAAVQALLFAAVPCAILWLAMFDGAVLTKPLCTGITLCLCALALAWAVFAPIVRFRRYRYKLAEDRIEIQEGIFYIRRTMVPIDRIHQIDIVRGPLDKSDRYHGRRYSDHAFSGTRKSRRHLPNTQPYRNTQTAQEPR